MQFFYGQRVSTGGTHEAGYVESMGTIGAFVYLDRYDEDDIFKHMYRLFDELDDLESREPMLVIHRGLPGSGKTTAVNKIRQYCVEQKLGFYHHEADHYHYDGEGNYNWKPENISKAHKQCQQLTRESLENAKHEGNGIVVVANTNTTHKEMKPYLMMADELGIKVRVVAFGTEEPISKLHSRNLHNVPLKTLEKMRARWQPYDGEVIIP